MTKVKASTTKSPAASTVILDLGAYKAKLGLIEHDTPKSLSNCVFKAKSERKRQFISGQLSECKDQHQLYHLYPFANGILTSWELEERILDYFFGEEVLNVDTRNSNLVVTEPYFNFQNVKKLFTEAIFEEYEFASAVICPPAYLSAHLFRTENPHEPTCLIVDSGHSFTHVIPVIEGAVAWHGVIRIPVGGKIITNHLKNRISFQQINVLDETQIINQIKELTCYVSVDLKKDFQLASDSRNSLTRSCGLPDYVHHFAGYVKPVEETFSRPADYEQLIQLSADRFVAPEILFRPSIIGDARMGLSEVVVESIRRFPRETQLYLFRNIVLTGGCCLFTGLKERLQQDIAPEVPEFGEVEVLQLGDPLTTAWYGGKALVECGTVYDKLRVTKAEYEENGGDRKFVRAK